MSELTKKLSWMASKNFCNLGREWQDICADAAAEIDRLTAALESANQRADYWKQNSNAHADDNQALRERLRKQHGFIVGENVVVTPEYEYISEDELDITVRDENGMEFATHHQIKG